MHISVLCYCDSPKETFLILELIFKQVSHLAIHKKQDLPLGGFRATIQLLPFMSKKKNYPTILYVRLGVTLARRSLHRLGYLMLALHHLGYLMSADARVFYLANARTWGATRSRAS